jgi:hypothetical protein
MCEQESTMKHMVKNEKTQAFNPVAQEQYQSEHLQEFTLKRKVDRAFYCLASISSNIW